MTQSLFFGSVEIAEFPPDWGKVRIDANLVDILGGFACARKNSVSSGVPHLRPFNIDTQGQVIITDDTVHIPPGFRNDLDRYHLLPGDVLFNNTNSVELVGKTAMVREPMAVAFSNHITRLRAKDTNELDPRWLALSLRLLFSQGIFAQYCNKWIGQAGFSTSALAQTEIPLPPLETQRRIVARIEALLTELRAARELHEKVVEDTGRLMEAVLNDTYSELAKSQPLRALGDLDICDVIPGQHIMSKDYSNVPHGTAYITGPADFGSKYPNITKWTEHPKALCYPGDVLFTVKGSGVGRVNCAPMEGLCAIGRQVMALRPTRRVLNSDYLFYALWGRFREFQELRQGAAIPGIRKEHVQAIELPVPPTMALQEQVVARLESFQLEVSEMQRSQAKGRATLEAVEQAILAQAFRGEL